MQAAFWQDELPALLRGEPPILPHGLGRSYGDSCQNAGGTLIGTSRLDRLIGFDPGNGSLEAEAGATLDEILRFALPRGWFLRVTPGTRFVTLGGAIANDVHGKNHHSAGTFGRHVLDLRLLRSDGTVHDCAPAREASLFNATLGGLGLTGVVASARIALRPVSSAFLEAESIAFGDLGEFFALADASSTGWEYTVAWIDCASRAAAGRGLFQRASHSEASDGSLSTPWKRASRDVPFDFPGFALSPGAVRLFNALYWRAVRSGPRRIRADRFLFPLDGIGAWNRIYGRRGLLQFQCVVPRDGAREVVASLIDTVALAREGSFLSVLKTFGELPSPGMLSFPRPGVTFALDFPMRGASTLALVDRLEAIACEAKGAIYPAKDARMSPAAFRASFPRADEFEAYIDPALSSSLWRRVRPAGMAR